MRTARAAGTALAAIACGMTTIASAQEYAPGTRVDAYLGGRDWQSCVVVRHNVRQGDYEVQCDGKPDTSRVGDAPDHIRPATDATRAATATTNARQAALRRFGPDIDANLRPVALRAGGKPLSGIYLQLKPMMGNAALGRMSYDYFTFWPDGRVCEMLPIAGADPADHDAMKKDKPRLCGRYVFTSSKLTIDVPDYVKTFDYDIANFDGTNFTMNGYPTVRVAGYGGGAVLNSRYTGTRLFPTTFRMDLALSSNGEFELLETPRDGSPVRHLRGRYRLFGNTLDLGSERPRSIRSRAAAPGNWCWTATASIRPEARRASTTAARRPSGVTPAGSKRSKRARRPGGRRSPAVRRRGPRGGRLRTRPRTSTRVVRTSAG